MPEIDRLLPKPAEEMTMTEVHAFMEKTQEDIALWLAPKGRGVKRGKINPDHVIAALQCIAWGIGMVEGLMAGKNSPEYNPDEAVWFIRQRTDLPDDVIRKVLDADEAYMVDKGIIPKDEPDIPTLPGVQ